MKKVTLRFNDEQDLRRFAMVVSCWLKIDLRDLTLVCECEEAEIELAKKGFSAKVIK